MPPAALSSIVLTDGTTTATLSDTSKYGLLAGGWSPQVATRRKSVLGGRPYTQVVEELRLDVYGTSTADALSNLAVILRLIDQADRWHAGESFSPVVLQYQPQGSILAAPVKSLVYGFGDNSPPATLPATYNDLLMVYEIADVLIRFVRDGAWLGEEETVTGTTSVHPEIADATFTGFASHFSPVKLEIGPLPSDNSIGDYVAGFVLVADRASRLEIVEAETMASGAFTADADAARFPSGTGVLVYTPASTSEATATPAVITLAEGHCVGIVAAVRNSHATTAFSVRVSVAGNNDRNLSSTRPVIIEPGSTDPRFVMLGVVLCEEDYGLLYLHVAADAVAGTLSIDYLALVNLDNPTSRILAVGTTDTGSYITDVTSDLTVDPRALEKLTPRVRLIGQTNPTTDYAVPESSRGDAYLLSLGTTIAALYVGAFTPGGYWRLWDDSGAGGSYNPSYVFTRRIAYLAPE